MDNHLEDLILLNLLVRIIVFAVLTFVMLILGHIHISRVDSKEYKIAFLKKECIFIKGCLVLMIIFSSIFTSVSIFAFLIYLAGFFSNISESEIFKILSYMLVEINCVLSTCCLIAECMYAYTMQRFVKKGYIKNKE